MSSRSKDRSDRSSDRHSHRDRRDSSPRRRRRSESPPTKRDERELPEGFGPGAERRDTTDDNLNVLQRMQNITGPLELLSDSVNNGKELKIFAVQH
ncbi:uncharacterized protein LOC129224541 isoform X2 [Uloborus diversus]|uniref:uncharacterized protein LOC129224541 isoform X2 n=1 Tax=Uloborus diversus TaxID=327109 RepID=UPI002409D19D|nr:uncharacterized protein LOC129224541 isoform X2 [Uloborus diversus]